jgi:hypothetical protein
MIQQAEGLMDNVQLLSVLDSCPYPFPLTLLLSPTMHSSYSVDGGRDREVYLYLWYQEHHELVMWLCVVFACSFICASVSAITFSMCSTDQKVA